MNKPKVRGFVSVWDAIADAPEAAANLRVRSELMGTVTVLIEASGWKQPEAARQLPAAWPNFALLAGCIGEHYCGVGAARTRGA